MYHKVKNTLAGLGMVALFVAGGLFFSEPVPAGSTPVAPASLPAVQARVADQALVLVLARTRSQLRLQAGMPYYSFGALLPRREES